MVAMSRATAVGLCGGDVEECRLTVVMTRLMYSSNGGDVESYCSRAVRWRC